MRKLLFLVLIISVLSGCASLPLNTPRTSTTALPQPEETSLWRRIQPQLDSHPGDSGFYLLPSGIDAFVARILLIDAAERTLDMQYYIFHGDVTPKLVVDRMLAAADRGVRIRLLVDDWNITGKDFVLAMIDVHPNIEVRVFNPVAGSRSSFLSRPFHYLFGAGRIKNRMHNKAFIVDNTVAIVGGRNIGDEYFQAEHDVNFEDIDLMALGPIAREVSAAFDEYWNYELAIPIQAFVSREPTTGDVQKARRTLDEHREALKATEYGRKLRESDLLKRLEAGRLPVVWAQGEVLYDRPRRVNASGPPDPSNSMGPRLREIIEEAQSEALLISPYFVPGEAGVKMFAKMRDRGVTVKILTNSLASNDVPVAHGGYARYRKNLLRMGVDLFELRPVPGQRDKKDHTQMGGSSGAALHAKTFILDRQVLFVGTLNLDPRSVWFDTQNGISVRSETLAGQAARLFEESTSMRRAYQVRFKTSSKEIEGMPSDDIGLEWVTEENGKEVRYFHEPKTGLWRRISVKVLSLVAPEKML
jgi:putative cardiolipin synthase